MPHFADHVREPLISAFAEARDSGTTWDLWVGSSLNEVSYRLGHLWHCSNWAPGFMCEAAADWMLMMDSTLVAQSRRIREGCRFAKLVRTIRPIFVAQMRKELYQPPLQPETPAPGDPPDSDPAKRH